MTIYLYVKTHRQTGLKYLGKTTAADPHRYTGSGIYWRDHLRVHGVDYDTEILKECQTAEEVKYWGSYYSNLWDVVNARDPAGNKTWANLKPEEGDGGYIGRPWTESERQLIRERQKGQISPNRGKTYEEIYGPERAQDKVGKLRKTWQEKMLAKPPKAAKPRTFPHHAERIGMTFEEIYGPERALEIRTKQSQALSGTNNPRYGKPGTFKDRKHSEESLAKMRKATGTHKNPRKILVCPHCEKASDSTNAKRWHFDNCKLKP
jgi:hypothetical protein